MNAFAFQGIEVSGEGRDERLALAGLHFGDGAAVQHRAADDLDVEVPHVQDTPAGLANNRKRLGHEVAQGFALGKTLAELQRFRAKLLVGQLFCRRLEGTDLFDERT